MSSQTKALSASGIEKWKQCERRWAWIYLTGTREPFAEAAQAGTQVHALLEKESFDQYAVWNGYEIGKLAAKMAPHTPLPVLHREQKFEQMLDGILFGGVIDVVAENAVADYKTTGRRKNVKSEVRLIDDTQRLLYSQVHVQAEFTRWIYGVWEDFSVHPVDIRIDRPKDRERFKLHVLTPAEEILAVDPEVDILSLRANKDACNAYPASKAERARGVVGGCPFKSKCTDIHGEKERFTSGMSKLLEKLRKQAADAQPELEPEKVVETQELPRQLDRINAPAVPAELPPELEPPAADEPAAAAPKKRGRRSKAEIEAAKAAEAQKYCDEEIAAAEAEQKRLAEIGAAVEAVSPALGEETQKAAALLQNLAETGGSLLFQSTPIGTLYIDCLPLTNTDGLVFAHTLLAQCSQSVADATGSFHPMLIDFGKGGPLLAYELAEHLKKNPVRALYLETRSGEGRAVMQTLMGLAGMVVRGGF